MAKKANIEELHALHALVAKYYSERLEEGEELSSGTLNAINAFLKNNNITVDVVESEPLQNLSHRIQQMVKEEA